MFIYLFVLQALAEADGGAGLSKLHEKVEAMGYSISLYKLRKVLSELRDVGAIARVGNVFFLRVLGANIAVSDKMAAYNWPVIEQDTDRIKMPVYQKEY